MKEALLDGDLAAVNNVEALLGSGQALSCHIEYKSLASFVLSSQIADAGTIGCIGYRYQQPPCWLSELAVRAS